MNENKGIEVNTSPEGYAKCLIAKHGTEHIQGASFDTLVEELIKQGASEENAQEAVRKAKEMSENQGTFKEWCRLNNLTKS